MAGLYSRFREFSYEIPKFLLPLSNRTILHFILKSFDENFAFSRVILVVNKRDKRFVSQIKSTLKDFAFPESHCIFVDNTSGQNETALKGLEFLDSLSTAAPLPICIHNIDTILHDRNFQEISTKLKRSSCVIDTFTASNESYSYVLEENSMITSIMEKKVVSTKASSGCYFFKNIALCLKYIGQPDDHYISDAINLMISDGLPVEAFLTEGSNNTIVLGTPEEYLNSMDFFHLSINEGV